MPWDSTRFRVSITASALADQDRFVGQGLLGHAAQDLVDLHEIVHRGRHLRRIVGEGPEHAVAEIVHHRLAAEILLLRGVGEVDEIAALGAARRVALRLAGFAVPVHRRSQPAEDHRGRERGVDDVEPALRRHVHAGAGEARDIDRDRLLHRLGRDLHVPDVVMGALVRPHAGLGPRLEDDVDPLLEDLLRLHEVGAEGLVLGPVVAAPGGVVDPPAANQVERRPALGDVDRVMDRQHVDRGREPDAFGHRDDARQHQVGARVDAEPVEMVLADPGGVKAQPVGEDRLLADLQARSRSLLRGLSG